MLLKCLIIGTGGFAGAVLRHLCNGWVQTMARGHAFPWGTLVVNISGCLMIGLLAQAAEVRHFFSPNTHNLVFIGFLGAFTTFSTFGNETVFLIRDGKELYAFGNMFLHLTLGLMAIFAGRYLALILWK